MMTRVYIIVLISAENIDCRYSLEYLQSIFSVEAFSAEV